MFPNNHPNIPVGGFQIPSTSSRKHVDTYQRAAEQMRMKGKPTFRQSEEQIVNLCTKKAKKQPVFFVFFSFFFLHLPPELSSHTNPISRSRPVTFLPIHPSRKQKIPSFLRSRMLELFFFSSTLLSFFFLAHLSFRMACRALWGRSLPPPPPPSPPSDQLTLMMC